MYLKYVCAFALFVSNFISCQAELPLVITTKQGDIKGEHLVARNGDKFVGYHGIPFAEPPLGDLRFAAPRPSSGWKKGVVPGGHGSGRQRVLAEPGGGPGAADGGRGLLVSQCVYQAWRG